MTAMWWIGLVLLALADDPSERAAMNRLMDLLNDSQLRMSAFCGDVDAQAQLDGLVGIHAQVVNPSEPSLQRMIGVYETWSNLTMPTIVAGRVRLMTPQIAILDAASTVNGAVSLRRKVPLRLVLRRQNGDWRIASIRLAPE